MQLNFVVTSAGGSWRSESVLKRNKNSTKTKSWKLKLGNCKLLEVGRHGDGNGAWLWVVHRQTAFCVAAMFFYLSLRFSRHVGSVS